MNWGVLIVLLLGGLAVFLHGMTVMTDGLKAAAGSRMKVFLKAMTRNRWTSLFAGTGITAVIQSSSVTTVLAVGFVSAGLLSFQSTLGLILGANLGTTITAQIIAFKVTNAAWVMVAFGYLFSLIFSKKSYKEIGTIIMGLGLVFLGMNVMSEATQPLKDYEPFIQLMKELDNYVWGILIGALFTAAVQSSSATTGVVIVLASQGLIGVEAGIAIIFGANIGTCVTAVLSAIGKPRDAMRVAFSHVFFNVVGVFIWIAFIGELSDLVGWISGNDKARQIANAHTLFNVANTIIFIGLVNPISKLVLFILPEIKKDKQKIFPELHSYYLENSSMALDFAQQAILKMGENTISIIENGIDAVLVGNAAKLVQLRKRDEIIDSSHAEILLFLQQIQSDKISAEDSGRLERFIETVNILETTSDLITTDLVEAAEHRIEKGFVASENTVNKLTELYNTAVLSFRLALNKFSDNSDNSKSNLSKAEFKNQLIHVRTHLMQRLNETDEMRISIYRFESEMLESIRRLHALSRRLDRKAN